MKWLKFLCPLCALLHGGASGADAQADEMMAAAAALLSSNRCEEARQVFRTVIALSNATPRLKAESWMRIGRSFVSENRVKYKAQAVEAFEQVLRQEGLTDDRRLCVGWMVVESLLNIGDATLASKARDMAMTLSEQCKDVPDRATEQERLRILIGKSYYQETNYPAAKAWFEKLLHSKPRPLGENAAYRYLGMIRGAEQCAMEVRLYPSSLDPALMLSAEFHLPPTPKPLCLFFHGWHMTADGSRRACEIGPLLGETFLVNVDMRGRGRSGGKADASGFELIDGLDAIEYARRTWPDRVDERAGVFLVGGSGGGGNTLSLAGKAPDLFSAAVSWAGLSDYALLYERDTGLRVRDEMEVWIGGTPESNPEGYASRSGMNVVENVLTELLVLHGRNDSVPMPDILQARAASLGKTNIMFRYNELGHDSIEWGLAMAHLKTHATLPALPPKGRLAVNSFVACRAFWLVLDDPARMGWAEYELDGQGRLAVLAFSQDAGRAPVVSARLRLAGPGASVAALGETGALVVEPVAGPPGCTDVLVKGRAPWRVNAVFQPPAGGPADRAPVR